MSSYIGPNNNKTEETPIIAETSHKTQQTPFWANDPNILLQDMNELFPNQNMSLEKRINAISRLVIIITIIGFLYTGRLRILIIGGLTLISIVFYYSIELKKYPNPETFLSEVVQDVLQDRSLTVPTDIFDKPTESNPMSNVMLPDYTYRVDKKPAPPASNPDINAKILNSAKQMVIDLNKGNTDIKDKLFKSLGDEFEFDQSQRQFFSMPNTQVVNDQKAFCDFLYGSMISAKEGNLMASARNKSNYNLY